MIGTSLNLCVKDIVQGKVSINDVEVIFVGSAFESSEDAIRYYTEDPNSSDGFWVEYPETTARVCIQLWEIFEVIVQTGKWNPRCFPYTGVYWYKDIDEFKQIQENAGYSQAADAIARYMDAQT